MKRFTETTKWSDPWFRKLSLSQKCLWSYLCDNCDQAGVIDPDWDLISFQIGETVSSSDLVAFKDRISIIKGKLLIVGFVKFQYGKLSKECKPHIPVFKCLRKHGLDSETFPNVNLNTQNESLSKSTVYPIEEYAKGIHTLEEKEKEKDKEKESEKEKDELLQIPKTWTEGYSERTLNWILILNSCFHRKQTTQWEAKELSKLRELIKRPDADDELATLEKFYHSSDKYLRRDIYTLLNNWAGELDRARRLNGYGRHHKATGIFAEVQS